MALQVHSFVEDTDNTDSAVLKPEEYFQIPSRSSAAFRVKTSLAIVSCIQFCKTGFRIEVLIISACFSFFNRRPQRCKAGLIFLVLQESQARPDNLAGIVVSAGKDAGLDEFLEMRT